MLPATPRIVLGNIRGRMITRSVGRDYMAAAMGMCLTTLYSRFAHPEDFTLKELEGAARVLHTSVRSLMTLEEDA